MNDVVTILVSAATLIAVPFATWIVMSIFSLKQESALTRQILEGLLKRVGS